MPEIEIIKEWIASQRLQGLSDAQICFTLNAKYKQTKQARYLMAKGLAETQEIFSDR